VGSRDALGDYVKGPRPLTRPGSRVRHCESLVRSVVIFVVATLAAAMMGFVPSLCGGKPISKTEAMNVGPCPGRICPDWRPWAVRSSRKDGSPARTSAMFAFIHAASRSGVTRSSRQSEAERLVANAVRDNLRPSSSTRASCGSACCTDTVRTQDSLR
jgi:hypothetical protein